jgi:hypothetical protein
MADAKITALNAMVTPVSTDLLVIVDDPGGAAETQKITVANLAAGLGLTETGLNFSDITTANSSSDEHGLLAKIPGNYTSSLNGMGLWVTDIISKTTDETVSNSTTLQDDDELFIAVDANGKYYFDSLILMSSTTDVEDVLVGFSVPAGATMLWDVSKHWPEQMVAATAQSVLHSESGTESFPSGNGTWGVRLTGIIIVAAAAGNVVLRWCQSTATVCNTKVLANSILIVRRFA